MCPSCGGGVNGPERPRRDDVRRYCLDCSTQTGRLVERTCPALDAKRVASRERAAAKAASGRARAQRALQLARSTSDGIDLLDEAKRYWRLPVMREQRRWRRQLPEIEWRRSRSGKRHTSGRSGGRWITITIGTDSLEARETLLHELVHSAVGVDVGHGEAFYRVLTRAAREAWPDAEIPNVVGIPHAWARDRAVVEALRAHETSIVDDSERLAT